MKSKRKADKPTKKTKVTPARARGRRTGSARSRAKAKDRGAPAPDLDLEVDDVGGDEEELPDELRMPWDKAPGEGDIAFAAFKVYRDMGLERSHVKVSAQLHKHVRLIHRWSATWRWRERVEAFDVEMDRIEVQRNMIEVRKMRKRHADIAMEVLEKALKQLAVLKPSELYPGSVLKFIELGTKLEARARGEPEEHTQTDQVILPQKPIQTITICGKRIEF